VNESIARIIEAHPDVGRPALIPILQEVQEKEGYLSREAAVEIGRHLGLAPSKVYGVATFYNQFRFAPRGKYHVRTCRGTACHVKRSAGLLRTIVRTLGIEPGQTTRDGLFSLEVVACMGSCGPAPIISVNGEFFAKLTAEKVEKLLNSFRRKAEQDGQAK
jgi:NADH-quinone oxidoreductase subunit E